MINGRWKIEFSGRAVLAALLVCGVMLAGCVSDPSKSRASNEAFDQALRDHIQLALSYIGEGNRDAARHHLQKALEIDKNSPGAHNGMALLYQTELENDLAETHFKKAIALDGNFSRARNNFGVFLFQQERYQEAYEQFSKAAADTAYPLRPQAFVSLGITARKLGDEEGAVEAWTRAVTLNPRLATAYLELADYYFDNRNLPQAKKTLEAFEKVSRPTPRSLWLGVRIEDSFGNRDARASKGLALEKLFPYSRENLDYQEWLKNERKQ